MYETFLMIHRAPCIALHWIDKCFGKATELKLPSAHKLQMDKENARKLPIL